jgi:hypothetical protein
MSDSPIFDSLIVEFAEDRDIHFPRLINADEIMTKDYPPAPEPDKNDITKNTLYDATKLKLINPAIPEYETGRGRRGMQPNLVLLDEIREMADPEATQEMNLADAPTTVMAAIKAADKELGLDEWDEAFDKAAEQLPTPSAVLTLPKKATPEDVRKMQESIDAGGNKYGVKVEEATKKLPRRRNTKKRKPVNANIGGNSNFFETGTSDSPGSAA